MHNKQNMIRELEIGERSMCKHKLWWLARGEEAN